MKRLLPALTVFLMLAALLPGGCTKMYSVSPGASARPTATATPTATHTATATTDSTMPTPSPTVTHTVTVTLTASPSASPIITPTLTATPTVSTPNAGRIAFISNRDDTSDEYDFNEVYVMNTDGTGQTRLTDHSWIVGSGYGGLGVQQVPPCWSPDGAKIAFTSVRLDYTGGICVMNADGTGQTFLDEPDDGWNLSWSPDGTKIAYDTIIEAERGFDVFTVNAEGTNPVRLTCAVGHDAAPDWSPDGSKICYNGDLDGHSVIYVMNADGTNPARPAYGIEGECPCYRDSGPRWSPDGARIVYSSNRDGCNEEIYVMNTDGTNPVRLTQNAARDFCPCWSPDGSRIVFSSNRDGDYEIYAMNADGTNPTRLTDQEGDDLCPAWR
jgi:Tol biopolymer transport system component